MHAPLWAAQPPEAAMTTSRPPTRPAVAGHFTESEFPESCSAYSQQGDSLDEHGILIKQVSRSRRPLDADPLPGRRKGPETVDAEVAGNEPAQEESRWDPPRNRRCVESALLQKKRRTRALWQSQENEDSDGDQFSTGPTGPCGFHFASFGQDAADDQKRADEFNQLKRSPCNVLCVCEATDALFDYLQSKPTEFDEKGNHVSAVAGTVVHEELQKRSCHEWHGIKGKEATGTPLIAVRAAAGSCLQLVWWEQKSFGSLNGKKTWTRVIVCKVMLEYHAVGLGDAFNVMCIHVHNSLGHTKNVNPGGKADRFLDWFVDLVESLDVKVVCGDFNMLLIPSFERCRSRGIHVDLAGWNTFKIVPGNIPAWDSCAGFFVNCPGHYQLQKGARLEDLDMIADDDNPQRNGLYVYKAYRDKENKGLGGPEAPGFNWEKYVPKHTPPREKLRQFLTPSKASQDALADATTGPKRTTARDGRPLITVKQKAADVKEWQGVNGMQRPGSHLPVVFFVEGGSNRTKGAIQRRRANYKANVQLRSGTSGTSGASGNDAGSEADARDPEASIGPPHPRAAVAAPCAELDRGLVGIASWGSPGSGQERGTPAAAAAPAALHKNPQAHQQLQPQQPPPQEQQQQQRQPQQQQGPPAEAAPRAAAAAPPAAAPAASEQQQPQHPPAPRLPPARAPAPAAAAPRAPPPLEQQHQEQQLPQPPQLQQQHQEQRQEQLPQPPPQPPRQLPLQERTPNELQLQCTPSWQPNGAQWPQTAVAASSSCSAAAVPLILTSPPCRSEWGQVPIPADGWTHQPGWGEPPLALPQIMPSTHEAGSWIQQNTMLGAVGYPAPPSPHAPAADNDPARAALIAAWRELLDASERRAHRLSAELKEARDEARDARDEAREARARELTCEHKFAEFRCEQKYNSMWRDANWHGRWWE